MKNETLTIISLCWRDRTAQIPPLTLREFWTLFRKPFFKELLSAGHVSDPDPAQLSRNLEIAYPVAFRVSQLFRRRPQLIHLAERLFSEGISIITVWDDHFPQRLIRRLGRWCPPYLFALGRTDRLNEPGLAVTGVRDITLESKAVAEMAGQICAANDIQIISGLARGIDRTAMAAAWQNGGRAVGVVAGSLNRLKTAELRGLCDSGQLTLLTPYNPETGFSAAKALGRNRLIYCMGTTSVVILANLNRGGAWQGASEVIRKKWAPVWVPCDLDLAPGNAALIEAGGIPVPVKNAKSLAKRITGLRLPEHPETPREKDTGMTPGPALPFESGGR